MMNSKDNNGVKDVDDLTPDVYDEVLIDEIK